MNQKQMNINRHNYEEYFLLYVDKELSAADRKAVEVFVQANPDLEEELLMLQQSIVKPEAVVFNSKQRLLKEEGITALQEKLLLLADGELPAEERTAVLELIAADADAAGEWQLLQGTKLQPGTTIVFEDKQSLYRKEPAKVVGIKWWRLAAAAIFIGAGIWGGMTVYNNSFKRTVNKEYIARGNDSKNKKQEGKQQVIPGEAVNNPSSDIRYSKEPVSDPKQLAVTVPQKNVTKQPVTDKDSRAVQKNAVAVNKKEPLEKESIAVVNEKDQPGKPSNNLPVPLYENINSPARNKNTLVAVQPDEDAPDPRKDIALSNSGLQEKIKGATLAEPVNPIARTAAYKENDNNVVYMNDEKTKRSKLGGFLRKVKRVIERTTNTKAGDGNSVKIAGFDIAIN